VGATDAFMRAVDRDGEYDLVNPRDGRTWARVRAREIFDLITDNAWDSGEPGMLYLDTINRSNPTPRLGPIEATNPCGEQPLLPYEACTLGSVNLARHLVRRNGRWDVDWQKLARTVRLGVHMLDNIVEANYYPVPEIERICRLGNRKIGLGVMGFADLLVRMGIPYDSEEGVATAERVMGFVQQQAHAASEDLAARRGPFPNFLESTYYRPGARPLRNATCTTIAPTGSISIIANCSSGIEPLFALAYVRRVLGGIQLEEEVHPVFLEVARERGFYSADLVHEVAHVGSIQHLKQVPEDVRRVFVTTFDVAPEWHVRMQAAFQRHTDNAVSKTINLPSNASREDTRKAFLLAYRLGCKGITVYRYGSRPLQTLSVSGYCIACAGEEGFPPATPAGDEVPALPRP